jgi:hypothetical protein
MFTTLWQKLNEIANFLAYLGKKDEAFNLWEMAKVLEKFGIGNIVGFQSIFDGTTENDLKNKVMQILSEYIDAYTKTIKDINDKARAENRYITDLEEWTESIELCKRADVERISGKIYRLLTNQKEK